jgi:aldose 1-epimerase
VDKKLHEIFNGLITLKTADYGARLVSLELSFEPGKTFQTAIGFQDLNLYERSDLQYFGATVGPVAGRLARGKYELDGLALDLEKNENANHLHGGTEGAFHSEIWDLHSITEDEIVYRFFRKAGLGGFPGDLEVFSSYRLEGATLILSLKATTTSSTPVNLTNHTYWNLSGSGAPATQHELMIDADYFIPMDADLLPTGARESVISTALDFRNLRPIEDLGNASSEPSPGFDHSYLLNGENGVLRTAANLRHPVSGVAMQIRTNAPVLQFYTGNRNPDFQTNNGQSLRQGNSICLETFGVNATQIIGSYPTITLEPGRVFEQVTSHTFST